VYFVFPISYPGLVTGSIVGLGEGWEAVVGAEIIVGIQSGGLGSFFSINSASSHLVIFGVLALLLFIFSLNKLVWLPMLERSHRLLSE
jgi:ABC-type anion transport system duplicated permease subunit